MYSYRIFTDYEVVVVRFKDHVSMAELLDYYAEIGTDSDFSPEMHGVVDLRDATLDITVADVKKLAEIGATNSKARWVIIVDNPHDTAFSVLYSDIVCEHHPLVVVSHDVQASKYLDVEVGPLIEKLKAMR